MINISQHSFVPRTKIQKGKYLSSNTDFSNSSVYDTFLPQLRFGTNFAYFSQDSTTNKLTSKVTYVDPFSQGGSDVIPENRVSILKKSSTRIAFGNNFSLYPHLSRGYVFEIAWYQPLPASLTLNSIDLPINDLDVQEDELI